MTKQSIMRRTLGLAFASMGLLISGFSNQALAQTKDLRQAALYTQTDATLGNKVIAFYRNADGTVTEAGRFPTQGKGLGAHLISAGSVDLATVAGNQYLYVTNSLSNDITVFSVEADKLTVIQKIASGGLRPVGTTVHGNLLYVIHEISATIDGFRVADDGTLSPIVGSKQRVTGGTISEPFQVLFNNAGTLLAVSDENTQLINTFLVDPVTGLAGAPIKNNAHGLNPFGMTFDQYDHLFSTSGGFDVPLLSSMSSFVVQPNGVLSPVSPTVGNKRQFECWILVTSDAGYNGGHFGYTDNTGDSTVSSYFIQPDGSMTLLKSVAARAASWPLIGIEDNAMTADSKFYYAVSLTGHINSWKIEQNGDLTDLQQVNGLPISIAGLAVR